MAPAQQKYKSRLLQQCKQWPHKTGSGDATPLASQASSSYKSLLSPPSSCDCETCTLLANSEKRNQVFENKYPRQQKDDIDGLAGEEEELANLTERLDKASTAYGMEISAEKSKLMTNNTSGIIREIKVNGQKLETVTSSNTWALL